MELSWLTIAGIAATTVMLLHGFLDVLLYSSRALPLILVPMGLAVAGIRNSKFQVKKSKLGIRPSWLWAIGLRAVLLVAVGLVASPLWNQIAAMWYANLGTVAEARVELGEYSFHDRSVEYVRRDAGADAKSRPSNPKSQISSLSI